MSRFVVVSSGRELVVDSKPLGTGGQGEVFRATFEGKVYALKLYHTQMGTPAQRKALERLVGKKSRSFEPYFLWPLHIVEDREKQRFGYLMELREPRFRSTEDLMARRVQPSFESLLKAAIQLSDAFLKLHSEGLCYRDISFGNIFIDPVTGDIRVCDNDNIDISGAGQGGVLGTPRFMAPEVVRFEAAPSDLTDRYSLSVLLFHLLMFGHPLDGARENKIRCMDIPAMNELYGTKPLYIFDPKDQSNRPVKGVHDNPLIYRDIHPSVLMKSFERAFTEGLHNPSNRIREHEWRKLFGRVRDLLMKCSRCAKQNFFDPETPQKRCWSCREALPVPALLKMPQSLLVLQPGVKLYPHHVQNDPFNYQMPMAEVVSSPHDAGLLGLKNLTTTPWTFTKAEGALASVEPGRSVSLLKGYQIHFGTVDAQVEK